MSIKAQPLFMRMSLFDGVLNFFLFPASRILLGGERWLISLLNESMDRGTGDFTFSDLPPSLATFLLRILPYPTPF